MKTRTILLYCMGIDEVLTGSSKVAGIQVQMSFWARTFVKHGWNVFSFTDKETRDIDGVHFLRKNASWLDRHGLSILQDIIDAFIYLRRTRANVVFLRGARRNLRFLQIAAKLAKTKVVFLGASDKDFVEGEELDIGNPINMKLFRRGLSKNKFFIAQNSFQADALVTKYGKVPLTLKNIWLSENRNVCIDKTYDAIWIANLRRLKRAEWFLWLAEQMPLCNFAIVGGVNEHDYYKMIETRSRTIANLEFLGAQSFDAVNNLFAKSKLLVCTSEFEGFPNTFLQAWANGVPVISTVDPSDVIKKYNLGRVINTETELRDAFINMIGGSGEIEKCQDDISRYFYNNHDSDKAYEKVKEYLVLS